MEETSGGFVAAGALHCGDNDSAKPESLTVLDFPSQAAAWCEHYCDGVRDSVMDVVPKAPSTHPSPVVPHYAVPAAVAAALCCCMHACVC